MYRLDSSRYVGWSDSTYAEAHTRIIRHTYFTISCIIKLAYDILTTIIRRLVFLCPHKHRPEKSYIEFVVGLRSMYSPSVGLAMSSSLINGAVSYSRKYYSLACSNLGCDLNARDILENNIPALNRPRRYVRSSGGSSIRWSTKATWELSAIRIDANKVVGKRMSMSCLYIASAQLPELRKSPSRKRLYSQYIGNMLTH